MVEKTILQIRQARDIKQVPAPLRMMQRKAVRKGYLRYNTEKWCYTFTGLLLTRFPRFTYVLDAFREVLPHSNPPAWEDLTDENLRKFVSLLKARYSDATVYSYTAVIRSTINARLKSQCIPCTCHADILRVKVKKPLQVWLNEDEIARLKDVKPKGAAEREVKRLFLLSALTGADIKDAAGFSEENLAGGVLAYTTYKTGKSVSVSIEDDITPLLRRPQYAAMPTLRTTNNALRNMCRRAMINDITEAEYGGKTERGEKWKFVTMQTARRTFATQKYLAGIPLQDIRTMMGHAHVQHTRKSICEELPFND